MRVLYIEKYFWSARFREMQVIVLKWEIKNHWHYHVSFAHSTNLFNSYSICSILNKYQSYKI